MHIIRCTGWDAKYNKCQVLCLWNNMQDDILLNEL